MEHVKISIIIPVFNKENYLKECLDSVIKQKLTDTEIIAINDGSTDDSLGILKQYETHDKRIKVVDQDNIGVGLTRNKGIHMATGEFVAFMDPDDWYPDENVLLDLYNGAKKFNVKICGGSFSSYINGRLRERYPEINRQYEFDADKLMLYSDYQFDYGYHRFIYDRKMLVDNNICFPDYQRFQDPPFFVRAMVQANQFYAMSRSVYSYREGYQTLNWTSRKTSDLLKGLIDNLKLSREQRLTWLHYLTYSRLDSDGYNQIFSTFIEEGNQEVIDLLFEANRLIDTAMIQQYSGTIPKTVVLNPIIHLASHSTQSTDEEITGDRQIRYPKVSIIIPVYNVANYIAECLNSITSQDYEEVEIICVDDGSTDHSVAVIRQIMESEKRIKLIQKRNGGLSSARNVGVQNATGEYLWFVDSDDIISKRSIEKLYREASSEQLDVLYFDATAFYESSQLESKQNVYKSYYIRDHRYNSVRSGPVLLSKMLQNKDYRSSACLQFIRREFYNASKLSFYEGIIHEDNLFTLIAILEAKRVKHVNKSFYIRRVREDSIMTKDEDERNLKGYFTTYFEALHYLKQKKYASDIESALINLLDAYKANAKRIYNKLSQDRQQDFMNHLSLQQKTMFLDALYSSGSLAGSADVTRLKQEVISIYTSKTYRIGRLFTYLPVKFRNLLRYAKENGFRKTLQEIHFRMIGR